MNTKRSWDPTVTLLRNEMETLLAKITAQIFAEKLKESEVTLYDIVRLYVPQHVTIFDSYGLPIDPGHFEDVHEEEPNGKNERTRQWL